MDMINTVGLFLPDADRETTGMKDAPRAVSNGAAHFGVHLTIDGYGGSRARLADRDAIWAFLDELPARIGMHKLAAPTLIEVGPLSEKDSGGVTGFVLIAESHISIHTFPLRGFLSADVYTCQNRLDTDRICRYFKEAFELNDIETNVITRGTRYPQHDIYGAVRPERGGRRRRGAIRAKAV